MKDKEKQIEEKDKMYILNTILQEVKPLKLREKIYWRIVEFVNNKLPKDSVMLSMEEICELKCQAEEDFNKAYDLGSKETAEKIYRELQGHGTTYVKKWIKEQFGVEIKE